MVDTRTVQRNILFLHSKHKCCCFTYIEQEKSPNPPCSPNLFLTSIYLFLSTFHTLTPPKSWLPLNLNAIYQRFVVYFVNFFPQTTTKQLERNKNSAHALRDRPFLIGSRIPKVSTVRRRSSHKIRDNLHFLLSLKRTRARYAPSALKMLFNKKKMVFVENH